MEGDRLSRKLGKGWKRILSQARASTDLPYLVDSTISALKDEVSGPLACPCLDEIISLIAQALAADTQPVLSFSSENHRDPYIELLDSLEKVGLRDGCTPGVLLAVEAAKSVYQNLEADGQAVIEHGEVRDSLLAEWFRGILRNRLLDPGCEALMAAGGRTYEEQRDWGEGLYGRALPQALKLLRQLTESDKAKIRAPKKVGRPKLWTLDDLNRPLVTR